LAGLKNYKPLILMAADDEDLEVISACLQDSLMKVGDFALLKQQRRFAMVVNRFVWEAVHTGQKKKGPFARVRSGVHFDDVLRVQQKNIRHDAKGAILSLMSIRYEAGGEDASYDVITMEFSGGGSIRLEVEAVNVQLSDISDPWPTHARPDHKITD